MITKIFKYKIKSGTERAYLEMQESVQKLYREHAEVDFSKWPFYWPELNQKKGSLKSEFKLVKNGFQFEFCYFSEYCFKAIKNSIQPSHSP